MRKYKLNSDIRLNLSCDLCKQKNSLGNLNLNFSSFLMDIRDNYFDWICDECNKSFEAQYSELIEELSEVIMLRKIESKI